MVKILDITMDTREEKVKFIIEEHNKKYGSTGYDIMGYLGNMNDDRIDKICNNLKMNVRDSKIDELLN